MIAVDDDGMIAVVDGRMIAVNDGRVKTYDIIITAFH